MTYLVQELRMKKKCVQDKDGQFRWDLADYIKDLRL